MRAGEFKSVANLEAVVALRDDARQVRQSVHKHHPTVSL
jgi:hypothetical protein